MENQNTVHVGSVDEDILEVIDLIHNYQSSADFSDWLTESKFVQHMLQENVIDGKYSRAVHYELDGDIFFNGRGQFYIDKLSKEAVRALTRDRAPISTKDPAYKGIKKTYLSKVIAVPYYTIVSQLEAQGEVVATTWEIYNLPLLAKIYQRRLDPMRYFRKMRTD